jgi:hypothetical protein
METLMSDRYLKIVLTVIAVELGWLAINQHTAPVAAQVQPAPTPVVIRGIDMTYVGSGRDALPISLVAARTPIEVHAERPLPIEAPRPIRVEAAGTVKITSDQVIKVENVGYTPARRPGE